jgi:hypothetical protein
MTVIDNSMVIE